MRAAFGLRNDPFDPHDNIVAGTAYLRAMYDRFGYPGFFAAYNVGPGRYARHLETGEPLPAETLAYLRKVAAVPKAIDGGEPWIGAATSLAKSDKQDRYRTSSILFVVRGVEAAQAGGDIPAEAGGLFAILPRPGN
jgi:hypothetical protein